jgi:hypothetical protein
MTENSINFFLLKSIGAPASIVFVYSKLPIIFDFIFGTVHKWQTSPRMATIDCHGNLANPTQVPKSINIPPPPPTQRKKGAKNKSSQNCFCTLVLCYASGIAS